MNRKNSSFCGMEWLVSRLPVWEKIEIGHMGGGDTLDNDTVNQLRNEGEIRHGAVWTTCVWIHRGFLEPEWDRVTLSESEWPWVRVSDHEWDWVSLSQSQSHSVRLSDPETEWPWVRLSDREQDWRSSQSCSDSLSVSTLTMFVSDIAIFVLKRDVKLQLTN